MVNQIKRRQFIKTTALAGSGALVFPNIIRSAKDKKLRIAMIGVSGRAGAHFGWAKKEKVTALCDVDTSLFQIKNNKKKKKSAVGRFPKAKQYQDYRELFEHPDDFDTVIISTPDHHHYPAAIRAIRAGKAVFCEKPLTWSAWEANWLASFIPARSTGRWRWRGPACCSAHAAVMLVNLSNDIKSAGRSTMVT